MKKKLFLIPVCLLSALTLAVGLAACGETESDKAHTHEYAATWSSDANKHWHACTASGDCGAPKKDEADHTWNDGEVTTPATAEEEGVKTYTCTVCGKTKTETVTATVSYTISPEEWARLFEETDNYTCTIVWDGDYTDTYKHAGTLHHSVADGTLSSKEGGKYYIYHWQQDESWKRREMQFDSDAEFNADCEEIGSLILKPFKVCASSFTYSEADKAYKCSSLNIRLFSYEDPVDATNLVVKFADGKIVSVHCEYTDDTESAVIDITDIGTTAVVIPTNFTEYEK